MPPLLPLPLCVLAWEFSSNHIISNSSLFLSISLYVHYLSAYLSPSLMFVSFQLIFTFLQLYPSFSRFISALYSRRTCGVQNCPRSEHRAGENNGVPHKPICKGVCVCGVCPCVCVRAWCVCPYIYMCVCVCVYVCVHVMCTADVHVSAARACLRSIKCRFTKTYLFRNVSPYSRLYSVCVCVCVCALVKADFRGHSQHFRPSYRGPC